MAQSCVITPDPGMQAWCHRYPPEGAQHWREQLEDDLCKWSDWASLGLGRQCLIETI